MPLATSSNSSGIYQLNLEPQKKNVFVTQLNDQPEEDDDIRRFAVVKESADQLLQTGVNTLQKTSLLRKAVEMEEIDAELAEKREEFRNRMMVNKAKQEELKRKQEKIRQRVTKFDKFLKENEAKRTRALRKYQTEVKENKSRAKELEELQLELDRLRERKEIVIRKCESYKIFETYLMNVIDALPENYLEMSGENMIHSVIQRFEGLSITHGGLINRNGTNASEIEEGQKELDAMKQERNKQKMVISSQLAELQKYQDQLIQRNRRLEQKVGDTAVTHRSTVGKFGRITMAINNLAEKCHARHWPPLSKMSYVEKLTMIEQHFHEQERVHSLIQQLRNSRHSVTSLDKPVTRSARKTETLKSESSIPKMPSITTLPKLQRKLTASSGFKEELTTIVEKE